MEQIIEVLDKDPSSPAFHEARLVKWKRCYLISRVITPVDRGVRIGSYNGNQVGNSAVDLLAHRGFGFDSTLKIYIHAWIASS